MIAMKNIDIEDFNFKLAKINLKQAMDEKRIIQKNIVELLGANQSDVSKKLNYKNERYKYTFFNVEELFKICSTYGLSMDNIIGLNTPTIKQENHDLLSFAKDIAFMYRHPSSGLELTDVELTELYYSPMHDESFIDMETGEMFEHDGFIEHKKKYTAMYFSVSKPLTKEGNPTSWKFNTFLDKLKKYEELFKNEVIEKEDYETIIESALNVLEKELKKISVA